METGSNSMVLNKLQINEINYHQYTQNCIEFIHIFIDFVAIQFIKFNI